jgi:hypothetical protein
VGTFAIDAKRVRQHPTGITFELRKQCIDDLPTVIVICELPGGRNVMHPLVAKIAKRLFFHRMSSTSNKNSRTTIF